MTVGRDYLVASDRSGEYTLNGSQTAMAASELALLLMKSG